MTSSCRRRVRAVRCLTLIFAVGGLASQLTQLLCYSLNVRISVKPEWRGEFLKCIEANRRGTLQTEPLAIAYLFGEDERSPNTFHFYEQYEGRAGFEAHTQTPHFANWEKFVAKDPFTEPPEVVFFQESDELSQRTESTAEKYCLNVRMGIKPARRDEFLLCIRNNRLGTLSSEPLALEYLYGEDENKPHTFHFHEQYQGRAGFEAHTQQPHFAEWERFAATDPFTDPPEVVFFTEHSGFRGTQPCDGVRSRGWDVRDSEQTRAFERAAPDQDAGGGLLDLGD